MAPRGELTRQLETDGDADEHAQPRLLADERVEELHPLLRILRASGLGELSSVGLVEPAALLERRAEHALQVGRRVRDDRLRVPKAVGVRERLHGSVDLFGRVALARHQLTGFRAASARPASAPRTAPIAPARALPCDNNGTSSRTAAMTSAPSRSASSAPPRWRASSVGTSQAHSIPSAAPCVPKTSDPGSIAVAAASAPGPQSRNSAITASGPWRRSIIQPNRPRPMMAANCAAVPSFSSAAGKKRPGSPGSAVRAKSSLTE